MTLPFRNTQPRKYRCFVCGREYTDYDEFRSHVIEEHEEGREYIICPLCEAPVRDARLHSRVKHPGRELPKKGQMRATVWYDFSGNRRKRNTKKPNFKEGYFVSYKNDGQPMHYRSGYELEVYECLEELKDVSAYQAEPKDCVTSYFWGTKWRKYWPDLKVQFIDGRVEVWEIKPGNQTDIEQNQKKWDACATAINDKGFAFKVMTEQGIGKLRKQLVEQNRNRN